MKGNFHVRFGERGGETRPPQGRKVRPAPTLRTGAFYSALLQAFPCEAVTAAQGFEIDAHYARPALALWVASSLQLALDDFTRAEPPRSEDGRFNLIVCNPPYVRHHHLPNGEKQRLQDLTDRACGVRVGGLAGLYCYFLCLAHTWLAANGVACWLIPSEFILNHSQATATNVYLLMYPKPALAQGLQTRSGLLHEIWQALNQISAELMIKEGRVYGGGLHKLEPRELANVPTDAIAELLR